MTQIKLQAESSINNIQEELHRKLLQLARCKPFEPIYMKKVEEKWVVDELLNIELKNGQQLKGFLLNSFDIVHVGSEVEFVEVKKEIFLLEDGELLVFNCIGKYFEESEDDTFFYITYRQIPEDQTLTANEFVSLIETVDKELSS